MAFWETHPPPLLGSLSNVAESNEFTQPLSPSHPDPFLISKLNVCALAKYNFAISIELQIKKEIWAPWERMCVCFLIPHITYLYTPAQRRSQQREIHKKIIAVKAESEFLIFSSLLNILPFTSGRSFSSFFRHARAFWASLGAFPLQLALMESEGVLNMRKIRRKLVISLTGITRRAGDMIELWEVIKIRERTICPYLSHSIFKWMEIHRQCWRWDCDYHSSFFVLYVCAQ